MRIVSVEQIGKELAIKWEDDTESFITLQSLRGHCPCAGCKGEVDIMGNLYKGPDKPLTPASYEIRQFGIVGGYGLQPVWGDGHSSGIFSFDYLRRIADES